MEMLRACYHVSMRPYADRPDIIIPGRWRWCPEGAAAVPYEHCFGSYRNDAKGNPVRPGVVGEVEADVYTYNLGASPLRATGKRVCGTAADWSGQAPYDPARVGAGAADPDGLPECCLDPVAVCTRPNDGGTIPCAVQVRWNVLVQPDHPLTGFIQPGYHYLTHPPLPGNLCGIPADSIHFPIYWSCGPSVACPPELPVNPGMWFIWADTPGEYRLILNVSGWGPWILPLTHLQWNPLYIRGAGYAEGPCGLTATAIEIAESFGEPLSGENPCLSWSPPPR